MPAQQIARATIVSREDATLCGTAWATETFRQLDATITIDWSARDGDRIARGGVIAELAGPARAVLTGERVALNFLQTLSATATAARHFVDAIAGTSCTILDTRKTIPGLRRAQKYAVLCGGASNHRLGLHDMVLIKENHIVAAGSIAAAIERARERSPGVPIEVEVESLTELEQAFAARPDIIMLDELPLPDLSVAVARNRALGKPVRLEASGSVTLENVRAIAATGVDFISIGGITKHVRAIDLSMRFAFGGAATGSA